MFKKSIVLFALTFLLIFPLVAFGVDFTQPAANTFDIMKVIRSIFGFIWTIFEFVAVIMFVFAGYMFLSANGDPGKIKLARTAFLWAIIGVLVGILAYSIPSIAKVLLKV